MEQPNIEPTVEQLSLREKLIRNGLRVQLLQDPANKTKFKANIMDYKMGGVLAERLIRNTVNYILETSELKVKTVEVSSFIHGFNGVKTASRTRDCRSFKATFIPKRILEEAKAWTL